MNSGPSRRWVRAGVRAALAVASGVWIAASSADRARPSDVECRSAPVREREDENERPRSVRVSCTVDHGLDAVGEREERAARIRGWFSQADLANHRGEFAVARDTLREILREDPANGDAQALRDIANEEEHTGRSNGRRRLSDEWEEVMAAKRGH